MSEQDKWEPIPETPTGDSGGEGGAPKVVSMSPSPRGKLVAKQPITFADAMLAVARGKRVRRNAWENREDYLYLKDGIVWVHRDGKDFQLLLSDGDILNNDWVVL